MSLFCTDCGKPKKEDQQFCIFCGKSHTISVTKLAVVDLESAEVEENSSVLINPPKVVQDETTTPVRSRTAFKFAAGVLLLLGIALGGFLTGKSSVDLDKAKISSYNDGIKVGISNGRTEGFDSGKNQGYNEGFEDGKTAGCNSVFELTGYTAVFGYDPTYDYTGSTYYSKSDC
jgi:flagellar biosynthesis/type III secretory pathway protein FliH